MQVIILLVVIGKGGYGMFLYSSICSVFLFLMDVNLYGIYELKFLMVIDLVLLFSLSEGNVNIMTSTSLIDLNVIVGVFPSFDFSSDGFFRKVHKL